MIGKKTSVTRPQRALARVVVRLNVLNKFVAIFSMLTILVPLIIFRPYEKEESHLAHHKKGFTAMLRKHDLYGDFTIGFQCNLEMLF